MGRDGVGRWRRLEGCVQDLRVLCRACRSVDGTACLESYILMPGVLEGYAPDLYGKSSVNQVNQGLDEATEGRSCRLVIRWRADKLFFYRTELKRTRTRTAPETHHETAQTNKKASY